MELQTANNVITVFLGTSMVIVVFGLNLRIQAVILRDQKRAASIPTKVNQAKKFKKISQFLFGAGMVPILIALGLYPCHGLIPYWIIGGITLFSAGGTLLVWAMRLVTEDSKGFSHSLYITSITIISSALCLFFSGILLWLWTISIPLEFLILAVFACIICLLLFVESSLIGWLPR